MKCWLSEGGTAPVDILTDLGMVQERNLRQTDAICIGNNTKKVIVTVTSEDDKIAQRHEKLGTVYKYRTLGSENVTVRKHCHDNNASIASTCV